MQSNAIAKIKSALNNRQLLLVLAAGVMLAAIFLLFDTSKQRTLQLGSQQFTLELAVSDKEHEKGLSGRDALGKGQGMLFVFQHEAQQCFWMKDMRFPIDIVWTSAKRKIVFLERNVSPVSYPRTFCSSDPAAYVIELPAGTINQTDMRKGQVLNF